ncbi:MAG: hypothetical protein KAT65_06210, partial [Methanophagales archaeon]|nr:hypothetical protein [Methanophagales archaeon]
MLLGSLCTIYNSKLCNDYVRSKVLEELRDVLDTWEKPPGATVMPPIGGIDASKFAKFLESNSEAFRWLKQGAIEGEVEEEEYLKGESFQAV